MSTEPTNAELRPQVLVIDDSVDIHRLLRTRMARDPVELLEALDGNTGVELAMRSVPAAILLDLDLPGLDGFGVLRALKDCAGTRNIPIIVVSGSQESQDKVTSLDLGAIDYVTKPFEFVELRARLRAALRLDRLLRLLAERAEVDGLTGLGNRAHFTKRWTQEVAEAVRYQRPLSLALLDVDHFKRINDAFGHPAGDEVLQAFGRLLVRQCRASDIPCRFGGEEFAIIMPGTAPATAQSVAERIRAEMARVVWARHPETPITVSIGVAGLDAADARVASPEAWIEVADRNLYEAKRTGRNHVVVRPCVPGNAPPAADAKPIARAG